MRHAHRRRSLSEERNPDVAVIAIEPQPGHRLPGLKSFAEAKEPGILDRSVIDHVVRVDDEPAYAMTERLWRQESLMVGPSTGAIVHAAASLETSDAAAVVGVSPDSGRSYTSYFVERLGDQGLPPI
jgi:cysteine synthase